jgi:homoserine O-acetyltransferase/O-succinyltransferase
VSVWDEAEPGRQRGRLMSRLIRNNRGSERLARAGTISGMKSLILRSASLAVIVLLHIASFAQDGQQQFASLGDFQLDNGQVIRDCRIGYRTFGQLNSNKSNAILFPTWFEGTTKELVDSFGPGKLVDNSKYFVVALDALGDGVSSSPSNSQSQARMKFPQISIRDMVRSQYRLATEVLHLNHIKAVMGISMGGMQTFQWMLAYPDFMDKAIPIVGSPRLAPYDVVLWTAENDAIRNDPAWKNGNYTDNPTRTQLAEFEALAISTPTRYNHENTREKALDSIQKAKQEPAFDANDHIRQSEAMMGLDISAPFGGSMERAAQGVKAKVLVIVNDNDHMVTPGPALQFGKLLHAQILELNNDCGHLLLDCEGPKVNAAVADFLAQ